MNLIALALEDYPQNYASNSSFREYRLHELSRSIKELSEQIEHCTRIIGPHQAVSPLLFKSTEFMAGDKKLRTYNDWCRFIKSGYAESCFTERIYKHLNLHCGYVAHYNRTGFYHTYWDNRIHEYARNKNLLVRPSPNAFYNWTSFCVQFNIWGDYCDINVTMIYGLRSQLVELRNELENEVVAMFQRDIANKSDLATEKKTCLDTWIEDLSNELLQLKRERLALNPESVVESYVQKYKSLFPSMRDDSFLLKGSAGNLF